MHSFIPGVVFFSPMYEMKQATIARAIDILRAGPMTGAAFAARMWPERVVGKSHGMQTKMAHALLRRIAELNYIERVGDLWMVRHFGGAPDANANGSFSHGGANGHAVGLVPTSGSLMGPLLELPAGSANGLVNGQATELAERTRLLRLVGQATEPVASVTHDAAFGNLAIRGAPLDAALVEASALVVLLGQNANVYPPCGAPQMLVGLSPAEGARALYLRWSQSGRPPDLPRSSAWIRVPDGFVATSGAWRPVGALASWVDSEDVRVRVQRQRHAAGLA